MKQIKATNQTKCWNWTTTRLLNFGDKYYSTYIDGPPSTLTIRKRVDTPYLFSAPVLRIHKFDQSDTSMKNRIRKLKCLYGVDALLTNTQLHKEAECSKQSNKIQITGGLNVKKPTFTIRGETNLTMTQSNRMSMFLYFCVAVSFLCAFIVNLREIQSFLLSKSDLTDEKFASQVGFPRDYYESICYILMIIIGLFVVFASGVLIEFIRNDLIPRSWKRYKYTYNVATSSGEVILQDLSEGSVRDGDGIFGRLTRWILVVMFVGVVVSFWYIPSHYVDNDPGQTRFLATTGVLFAILLVIAMIYYFFTA